MEIFLIWIVFSVLVGLVGKDKSLGFGMSFFWSLILSPLIGLIIVLASENKKPKRTPKHREYRELGDKAEFKGKLDEALEHYMDSLYHLQNDYKNKRITSGDELKRRRFIEELELKIKTIKEKLQHY